MYQSPVLQNIKKEDYVKKEQERIKLEEKIKNVTKKDQYSEYVREFLKPTGFRKING